MSRKAWIIIAVVCGLLGVPSFCWLAYNLFHVVPAMKSAASDGSPLPTWFDGIVTILSGLTASGLTLSSVVATVLAFVKTGTAAVVDKVAPNASADAKQKSVDITTIGAIQFALILAKDQPTRAGLITSGRAAFDDLRDRTFPLPVVEVTQ